MSRSKPRPNQTTWVDSPYPLAWASLVSSGLRHSSNRNFILFSRGEEPLSQAVAPEKGIWTGIQRRRYFKVFSGRHLRQDAQSAPIAVLRQPSESACHNDTFCPFSLCNALLSFATIWRSGADAEPVGFELGVDGREQNMAVTNGLSDRRIQTLGPGKHSDGNALYLRVEEYRVCCRGRLGSVSSPV
jgi:hypothetical protein